jgi:hypothetical protein
MTIRRAVEGLLALVRKQRLDLELDGEILAHLELAERDAMMRGLSPDEARRAARRSFGGIEQIKAAPRDWHPHGVGRTAGRRAVIHILPMHAAFKIPG